jgi:anaerobic selenocysteine-containing dehydrogenase
MPNKVKSFCRNCSALCAMELTVEGNMITNVVADGTASPYGAYMCTKGRSSVDFHNGEGRLTHTVKRTSAGDFAQINAAQALDEVAQKLSALLKQYGPRSIAVYYGTGAYRSVLGGQLQRAFLAAIGSPNQFSTMTIDQSANG